MTMRDDNQPATRGDIKRLERSIRRAFDRSCVRLVRALSAKIDALGEAVQTRGADVDRLLVKLDEISRKLDAWRGLNPDAEASAKGDPLH